MESILVPIALYGWTPLVPVLFSFLQPRRAILAAFILGWLFLPEANIPIGGLPDLNKVTATAAGTLLGVLIFDTGKLLNYRFSWVDIPAIVWCLTPMVSSLDNGLGVYDGLSSCLGEFVVWGIPYLLGRLYFNTLPTVRELALAILIGGLIYLPLCLFEVRFSPQLHRIVYGYHPNQFAQTMRWGGYRPTVFMQHGLMVGFWMTSASLAAIWLWRTRAVSALFGVPIAILAGAQLVTTVLCKSTGALALLAIGLGALFINRHVRTSAILLFLIALAPIYIALRATNTWDASELMSAASMLSEERASSLDGRLKSEVLFVERALQKPAFGWGSWGRWRVTDDRGQSLAPSDGLWIIALGRHGLVGLSAITIGVLLPAYLLVRRIRPAYWSHPAVAPAAVLAMLLIMYSLDNLFNAMLNPVYTLAAGALSGLSITLLHQKSQLATRQRVASARRPGPRRPAPAPARPPAPASP